MSGAITLSTVAAAATIASSVVSLARSGKKQSPQIIQAPQVTAPTAVPKETGDSVKAAEKASLVEQMRRRGRASTILTEGAGADTLGV